MPVDARGFQLVGNVSQSAGNLGSFVSQKINERLQQRALGGEDAAMARLSSRDPRAASQIGGILQDREQKLDVTRQREQQIIPRIAQGYKAASDKVGFLQQTSNVLRSQGFDRLADDVEDDVQRYATDPTSVDLEYEAGLAAFTDPSRAQQLTAAMRERQANLEALDGAMDESGQLKPRDQLTAAQESAAVALRIIPAAGTITGQERVAGDQEKTAQVARSQAEIAGAVKSSQEAAKTEADRARGKRSNQVAFNVYQSAISNLVESFDQATTGPGFGLVSAIGEDERILEGAIAIMRPTLKQIFRSAGEGTFTDKDQEQLDAMLPTRNDTVEVAQAKLNFIDSVVRAKFEINEGGAPRIGGDSGQAGRNVQQGEQRIIEVDF